MAGCSNAWRERQFLFGESTKPREDVDSIGFTVIACQRGATLNNALANATNSK
jgi:hypothetical protein